MNYIGQRIKTLRKQKKMTQQELVGERITRNQLSLIESGNANPSISTLEYIAERLGVTTSYLISCQPHSINEIELFLKECEYNNEEGKYLSNIEMIVNFLENYNNEIDMSIQNNIGKLYVLLGIAYYETKNQESEDTLTKALLLLDKTVSPDYVAMTLNTFAKHAYIKSNFAEMKNFLMEANKVLNEITLDTIILKLDIIYNIALACVKLRQFTEALDYIDMSMRKSKKHEVYRNYGMLQMLLALAYMNSKSYMESLDCTDRAIQYFTLFVDDIRRNYCIINSGIVHRLMCNYDKSTADFDIAYRYFDSQNDDIELLNIKAERLKTKFFTRISLTDILNEAQAILSDERTSALNRFDLLIISGIIQLELSDYTAAKASLTQAEVYYEDFAGTEFSAHLLIGLGKVYKQEGAFEKAYLYMERAQLK